MMMTKTSTCNSSIFSQCKRIVEVEISLRKVDKHFNIATRLGETALTQRELDCLYYLLLGLPAKLTALILHISQRTVEAHIESIKNKFGCMKKDEVVTMVNHTVVYRKV